MFVAGRMIGGSSLSIILTAEDNKTVGGLGVVFTRASNEKAGRKKDCNSFVLTATAANLGSANALTN